MASRQDPLANYIRLKSDSDESSSLPKSHSRFYWHVAALQVINEGLLATGQVVPEWLFKSGYLEVSRTAKPERCHVSFNRPEPLVCRSACVGSVGLEQCHCWRAWTAVLGGQNGTSLSRFWRTIAGPAYGDTRQCPSKEGWFAVGQEAG